MNSLTKCFQINIIMSHSVVIIQCHAILCAHTHTHTHTLAPILLIHICSGGIALTFIGTNLDVVQNPMLVVNDPLYINEANVSFKHNLKCTH